MPNVPRKWALEKVNLDLQIPGTWIRRSQARKIVSTPKNKRARFHVIGTISPKCGNRIALDAIGPRGQGQQNQVTGRKQLRACRDRRPALPRDLLHHRPSRRPCHPCPWCRPGHRCLRVRRASPSARGQTASSDLVLARKMSSLTLSVLWLRPPAKEEEWRIPCQDAEGIEGRFRS